MKQRGLLALIVLGMAAAVLGLAVRDVLTLRSDQQSEGWATLGISVLSAVGVVVALAWRAVHTRHVEIKASRAERTKNALTRWGGLGFGLALLSRILPPLFGIGAMGAVGGWLLGSFFLASVELAQRERSGSMT